MGLYKKGISCVCILLTTLILGCQPEDKQPPAPQPEPEEEVTQDFGEYQALRAEVLVRERTTSLVKFVKYTDSYMLGFGDYMDIEVSVFLKDNGKAYIFAEWLYPEYLEGGGKVWRTSEAVKELTWSLSEQQGIVVGEDVLTLIRTQDNDGYTGSLRPRNFGPPPKPLLSLVPEHRYSLHGWPVKFEVVSEVLEADVVNSIF